MRVVERPDQLILVNQAAFAPNTERGPTSVTDSLSCLIKSATKEWQIANKGWDMKWGHGVEDVIAPSCESIGMLPCVPGAELQVPVPTGTRLYVHEERGKYVWAFEKDGIVGHPDGIGYDADGWFVGEYKATKSPVKTIWDSWQDQMTSYCAALGMNRAKLIALHLGCGRCKRKTELAAPRDIYFTDEELTAAWGRVLKGKGRIDTIRDMARQTTPSTFPYRRFLADPVVTFSPRHKYFECLPQFCPLRAWCPSVR